MSVCIADSISCLERPSSTTNNSRQEPCQETDFKGYMQSKCKMLLLNKNRVQQLLQPKAMWVGGTGRHVATLTLREKKTGLSSVHRIVFFLFLGINVFYIKNCCKQPLPASSHNTHILPVLDKVHFLFCPGSSSSILSSSCEGHIKKYNQTMLYASNSKFQGLQNSKFRVSPNPVQGLYSHHKVDWTGIISV